MRTKTAIWTCILAVVLAEVTGAIRVSATTPGSLADYRIVAPSTEAGQTATLLADGRWLLLGGLVDGQATHTARVLDRVTGITATLPGRMLFVRAFHTATVLPDGTVFVFGGVGQDGADRNTAEIFDPANNSFSLFPYTNLAARSHHTATLLTSGELLIAGGDGDAVVFDPVTRTITRSMAAPQPARYDASAALLTDDSVLIWGGVDAHGTAIPDAALFNSGDLTVSILDASRAEELSGPSSAVPLGVAATVPADHDGAVPMNTRIAVRFSKYLQVTSINSSTVTLSGPSGRLAAHVVATNSGQQLFVTPAAELMPASRYTLSMNGLTDGIHDMPFGSIDFTTAPIALDDPNDGPWIPAAG